MATRQRKHDQLAWPASVREPGAAWRSLSACRCCCGRRCGRCVRLSGSGSSYPQSETGAGAQGRILRLFGVISIALLRGEMGLLSTACAQKKSLEIQQFFQLRNAGQGSRGNPALSLLAFARCVPFVRYGAARLPARDQGSGWSALHLRPWAAQPVFDHRASRAARQRCLDRPRCPRRAEAATAARGRQPRLPSAKSKHSSRPASDTQRAGQPDGGGMTRDPHLRTLSSRWLADPGRGHRWTVQPRPPRFTSPGTAPAPSA